MNHILYQICKIIYKYIIKKHEKVTDYHPIRIYVNKIKNRITFKIEAGYNLEHLK